MKLTMNKITAKLRRQNREQYRLLGVCILLPVLLVIHTTEIPYRFGVGGILAGLCFAAVLSLCVLILGIRFIRRADIMDVLNAGWKTEMVREIRPWTGKLGAVLVAVGLFFAMAVPQGAASGAILSEYHLHESHAVYRQTDDQKYVRDCSAGVCDGAGGLLGRDVLLQRHRRGERCAV